MGSIVYRDGIYQSKWLSKFINLISFAGGQEVNEKLVYSVFFFLKKKIKSCPLLFFFEVLEKIKPIVGLKIYVGHNKKSNKPSAISYILEISLRYKKAIY